MISITKSLLWWFISTVMCYSLVAIYALIEGAPFEWDLTMIMLASWAVVNSGWFFLIIGIAGAKLIRKYSTVIADKLMR